MFWECSVLCFGCFVVDVCDFWTQFLLVVLYCLTVGLGSFALVCGCQYVLL